MNDLLSTEQNAGEMVSLAAPEKQDLMPNAGVVGTVTANPDDLTKMLSYKFKEISGLVGQAKVDAIAQMPPEIDKLYKQYVGFKDFTQMGLNRPESVNAKQMINGFSKVLTFGQPVFDDVEGYGENSISGSYHSAVNTVNGLIGEAAGVMAMYFGGKAIAPALGIAPSTAMMAEPVVGGTVTRAAKGQSFAENEVQTAKEAGIALAGGAIFKGVNVAADKLMATKTVGKLVGSLSGWFKGTSAVPEMVEEATGLASNDSKAIVSKLIDDMQSNPQSALSSLMIKTDNPFSRSLRDVLTVGVQARQSINPTAEEAVSNKFFDLMKKWQLHSDIIGTELSSNPAFAGQVKDFLTKYGSESGVREVFSNPKKFLPGLSESDLSVFRSAIDQTTEKNMVIWNAKAAAGGGQFSPIGKQPGMVGSEGSVIPPDLLKNFKLAGPYCLFDADIAATEANFSNLSSSTLFPSSPAALARRIRDMSSENDYIRYAKDSLKLGQGEISGAREAISLPIGENYTPNIKLPSPPSSEELAYKAMLRNPTKPNPPTEILNMLRKRGYLPGNSVE